MRGKRWMTSPPPGLRGITPAGAGKTSRRYARRRNARDHPRRCGENTATLNEQTGTPGSPPQVRGKPPYANAGKYTIGITPAGAGKTIFLYSFLSKNRDHPRRCGENTIRHSSTNGITGSPPQVRGKLRCRSRSGHGGGITPAGAGKTRSEVNYEQTI